MNKSLGSVKEICPGPQYDTPRRLRDFIQNEAWGHHASCTNKIGADDDPMAVLDSRFRVRKTQALRVVDASVFPKIPGYFIVTAIYMISEKAADVIIEDAGTNSSASLSH
jgi:choline dehydrogenase